MMAPYVSVGPPKSSIAALATRLDQITKEARDLVPVDWLGEHGVERGRAQQRPRLEIAAPGAREDRQVRGRGIGAQRLGDDEPIDAGHAQIADDRVGYVLRREEHAAQAARGAEGVEAMRRERDLGDLQEVEIIIDDEDAAPWPVRWRAAFGPCFNGVSRLRRHPTEGARARAHEDVEARLTMLSSGSISLGATSALHSRRRVPSEVGRPLTGD